MTVACVPQKLTSIQYRMLYDIESRTGRSLNRARNVVPTLELHLDSSCKADMDEKRYMSNCCAILRERIDIETAFDIESFMVTAMLLSDVKPVVLS